MAQQMDPFVLAGQQIDPEVFRRVWNRVMPDQSASPIAVEPPGAPVQAAASRLAPTVVPPRPNPPVPAPPPAPQRPVPPSFVQSVPSPASAVSTDQPGRTDAQALRARMDQAWEGTALAQALARRMGNNGRALSALAADHRQALRQLSAAYFLATGQRYQPKGSAPAGSTNLYQGLREQFLWERQWAQDCREAAQRAGDSALRELYQQLALEGELHARTVRATLERIWGQGS